MILGNQRGGRLFSGIGDMVFWAIVALVIFVFLWLCSCGPVDHEVTVNGKHVKQLEQACDPKEEGKVQEVLSKWVYEHSNRISMADSKEIVFEARKSKRSLIMLALMEVESNFVLSAVSGKGALGLTQVMPGTWEKDLIAKGIIKERRDLFNIGPSVAAGDYVLGINLKTTKGDVSKALELYLGGQDGAYIKRISANLMNLCVLVEALR